ncbi:hypothetical protein PQR39_35565 [Paraburkholderia sediminicola]|uniref:hypothetical protein n=1 Tax=Paraburkholderia sediminicola TaxID=458836 RepID=UPI0038BAABAC
MSETKTFPESGIYLDDRVVTGKPSLGDAHTVSWLVRHFAKTVLDTRAGFMVGNEAMKDPLTAIEREAREMASIFQGHDERFDAQPWNVPARIGNLCRVLCPEETKQYGDPVAGLFMWVAGQVLGLMMEIEDGGDEAEIKPRIDAMLEDITARLLGVKY